MATITQIMQYFEAQTLNLVRNISRDNSRIFTNLIFELETTGIYLRDILFKY